MHRVLPLFPQRLRVSVVQKVFALFLTNTKMSVFSEVQAKTAKPTAEDW